MTATSKVDPTTLVERATEIGEIAVAHREQGDRDRRLADPVVEAMQKSGLLRIVRSRRLGGLEATPRDWLDVIQEISRHDVSAGWVFGVCSMHDWEMSYTNAQLQQDIWGEDPDAMIVQSLGPTGTSTKVDGGYVLNGTWRFASGSEWASWFSLNALVEFPDSEEPEGALHLVPRKDVEVIDDWNVVGLRGTASNSVKLEDVFVPEHRLFPFSRVAATGRPVGEVLDDGPLYHIPFVPMMGTAVFPVSLGAARQALAEYHTWTSGRIRQYHHGAAERQMPSAQLTSAECTVRLDAAYALAIRYVEEAYQRAQEGKSVPTLEERARFFAWRGWIVRNCAEIVDRVFLESGGNSLYDHHPMQRIWRDAHAAAQHVAISYGDAMTSLGRTQFGFEGHPFM
jgi:3-hydroxy-9,10-secoandrosta-1,3,5(10)-triene-9,17-dione monooxygenase